MTCASSFTVFQTCRNFGRIFMLLAVILALPQPVRAEGNPKYASIVMDAESGLILSQSYANKSLHPASLTKLMTLLMAFEALESGKLDLNDRVPISKRAASMVPSKLDLPVGSSIEVEDAIYALVTKSANDIAVALAEKLGGSEENFARLMTARARELGMTRTTFRNASGLHHPGQISTARDMAKLARVIINDYPDYYRYFSTRQFTYRGQTYYNHNKLMASYPGMDGMKTGYIGPSGFNLVASAVRNNQRLIGVVFGGRTAKTRNAHMAKLLDRGFARVNEIRMASAQVPLPPRKPAILVALNNMNKTEPASGAEMKWASLKTSMESGAFDELIGEGDYDPAASKRIETGLMAIAAHKGEELPESVKVALAEPREFKNNIQRAAHNSRFDTTWSIQIGAFASRAKTDRLIHDALKTLPAELAAASPIIMPLRTSEGMIYRGRLSGYNREEALRACSYLPECLPVPPQE